MASAFVDGEADEDRRCMLLWNRPAHADFVESSPAVYEVVWLDDRSCRLLGLSLNGLSVDGTRQLSGDARPLVR